jgi:AmiR/NasT family two-component response regulator
MAVGALMQRHSLSRTQAAERLRRVAREDGQSVEQTAHRVLDAVELLARAAR